MKDCFEKQKQQEQRLEIQKQKYKLQELRSVEKLLCLLRAENEDRVRYRVRCGLLPISISDLVELTTKPKATIAGITPKIIVILLSLYIVILKIW